MSGYNLEVIGMNNIKSNVWEDSQIIEIKEELNQEKIDGNLGAYASVQTGCTSLCY